MKTEINYSANFVLVFILDVDECLAQGVCDHGTCVNTMGNYTCTCDEGYVDSDNGGCVGMYREHPF